MDANPGLAELGRVPAGRHKDRAADALTTMTDTVRRHLSVE
jgi:hypothetical protein